MSAEFSAKLSMLRKEKNVTQRQAADALEVSQALLSHYEKGIRECSLDFVKRAALYYGVSADYLLGLTETKRGLSDLYALEPIETDETMTPKTALRAILYLSERSTRAGEAEAAFFCDYFSLAAQQYTLIAAGGDARLLSLCRIAETQLQEARRRDRLKSIALSEPAQAFSTAQSHARAQLQQALAGLRQAADDVPQ